MMLTLPKSEDHFVPIKETRSYNGIDLIKFLCAILVFTIHITPFPKSSFAAAKDVNFWLQQYICRLAVPFYFASSGFFLFKKMPLYDLDRDILKAYCFKVLRLLGTWHVLLFMGSTGHLWYLGATVVAVILLSLCFHFRIRLGYIYAIACILYLIGVLGDSYRELLAPLENIKFFRLFFKGYNIAFTTTRNGVFMGFIFVLIGATFSNCQTKLKPITALLGFAVSMLCMFIEVFLLKHNNILTSYNMYVFLLPATYFLFAFSTTVKLKDRPIYKHLRSIGMVIYFAHLFVNKCTSLAIDVINRYCHIQLAHYQFMLSLLFTILIAICVDRLACKKRFKWVNWIIS